MGNFDIYKQALGQRTAEPLVAGPKDECDPTLTPDGAWLFYFLASTPGIGIELDTLRSATVATIPTLADCVLRFFLCDSITVPWYL